MSSSLRARLLAQFEAVEGYRRFPYRDTEGVLTIGIGRNLETKGISHPEAVGLAENDLDDAIEAVAARWPWTGSLAEARLATLIEMCLNLGPAGLADFRQMWAALRGGDFERAAAEILDSDAARSPDAPGLRTRYQRLARQMRAGTFDREDP
jgi:lysozyme